MLCNEFGFSRWVDSFPLEQSFYKACKALVYMKVAP